MNSSYEDIDAIGSFKNYVYDYSYKTSQVHVNVYVGCARLEPSRAEPSGKDR